MNTPETLLEELMATDAWIQALARRLVVGNEEAEDVAQDAWVQVLTHRPDRRGPIRRWLSTVVRNLAMNRRSSGTHRLERERKVAKSERFPSVAELWDREETRRTVAKAIFVLEEPYRSVILYRYFENGTPSEIAARLDVSVSAVHERLRRGLQKLRARLDREFGDRRSWCAALLPLIGQGATEAAAAASASSASILTGALVMSTKIKIGIALVLALGVAYAIWPQGEPQPREAARDRGIRPAKLKSAAQGEAQGTKVVESVVQGARSRVTYKRFEGSIPVDPESAVGVPVTDDRQESVPFFCRLVSAADSRPLGGELVLFSDLGGESSLWRDRRIKTDAQGLFSVTSSPDACPEILTFADGFERVTIPFSADHRTASSALEVRLHPGCRLLGQVIRSDGQPGRQVVVALYPREVPMDDTYDHKQVRLPWFGATNQAGEFEIDGIPAGIPLLPRLFRERTSTAPGTETSAQGDFTPLRRLLSRTSRLVHERGVESPLSMGEVRRVQWSLPPETTIRGQVLDQDGAPVTAAKVLCVEPIVQSRYFIPVDDAVLARARTDGSGRFRITGIPGGRWLIGVQPETMQVGGRPPGVARWGTWIDAPHQGGEILVQVTVYRGIYISGRAVAPEGFREHIWVQATQVDAGAGFDGFSEVSPCEDDGSFVVGPLIPGSYNLYASRPDAESSDQIVDAGATDVVLHLAPVPGGSLRGRVVHRVTQKPMACRVQIIPHQGRRDRPHADPFREADPSGDFKWDFLQAGTYDLVATTPNGWIGVLQGVVVSAGAEITGLRIEMDRGGFVRLVTSTATHPFLRVSVVRRFLAGPILYPFAPYCPRITVPAGVSEVCIIQCAPDGSMPKVLEKQTVRVEPGQIVSVRFGL